jgi:hypothetical protein
MIDLRHLAIETACPACAAPLDAAGWHMPGMRMLARASCSGCGRDWFVDLPAGQGLYTPVILDPRDGSVRGGTGARWFADWLRDSWRDRTSDNLAFRVERRAPVSRPVVLINCLDTLYGHALLKLFNAQQYLDAGKVDVVLLVQPFLAALIPQGVAEVWEVELPLREGTRWSDGLAERIATECDRFPELRLAPVHPHPHPSTFSIERFSKVPPFDCGHWHGGPRKSVTFIWRDDRSWPAKRRLLAGGQARAVPAFFEELRQHLPTLDAAVAGLGTAGGLPGWIEDLRTPRPDAAMEKAWLQRYAASHAVIGVHGSNMLLPSAHAGSVFEFLPEDREGNVLQDLIFNGTDARDLMFRTRLLQDDIAPDRLASLVALVVGRYPDFDRLMRFEDKQDSDVRN